MNCFKFFQCVLEAVHFCCISITPVLCAQSPAMKCTLLSFLFIALAQHAAAQKGSAELMAGHQHLHYQHSLTQQFSPQSKLGWQHIATLIKRYQPEKGKAGHADELMNQAYLAYTFTKWLAVKGGLFYTNVGGYKPSLAVQFTFVHKNGAVLLVPRVDMAKEKAYELFFVSEYFVPAFAKTRLVARIQAMSNFSSTQHNRSYQLIRLGIDINDLQFGGGLTLDEYGTNRTVHYNTGFFVRKKW